MNNEEKEKLKEKIGEELEKLINDMEILKEYRKPTNQESIKYLIESERLFTELRELSSFTDRLKLSMVLTTIKTAKKKLGIE